MAKEVEDLCNLGEQSLASPNHPRVSNLMQLALVLCDGLEKYAEGCGLNGHAIDDLYGLVIKVVYID